MLEFFLFPLIINLTRILIKCNFTNNKCFFIFRLVKDRVKEVVKEKVIFSVFSIYPSVAMTIAMTVILFIF